MNGRSQADRLPRSYRLDCSEVWIRKDPGTGDVIIYEQTSSWDGFFERRDKFDVPDEFMSEDDNESSHDRQLCEGATPYIGSMR